jgi:hypothetical protein
MGKTGVEYNQANMMPADPTAATTDIPAIMAKES